VTLSRFNFYLGTGSSFVAEKDGGVVGYVATQTISYMRGHDQVLWIEYIVTEKKSRRRGVATALLKKLKGYSKQHGIDTIYATINPDNTASIKLHQKLGFNVKNWKVASLNVT
jgi:phosphinothricin acetyltransferase